MAFITAPLSSFPEDLVNKHNVIPGENLSTYTKAIYRVHNYFFIIKYTLITEAVLKEVPFLCISMVPIYSLAKPLTDTLLNRF